MPNTKGPQIDWLKAGILERKAAMHLEWRTIAERAGMNVSTLRSLLQRTPPIEWPVLTLKRVCEAMETDYIELLDAVNRLNGIDAEEDDGK